MNRLQLYSLLRHNTTTAYKRSPAFEQGVVAKVLMLLSGGMLVIYLLFFAVMFGILANDEREPAMLFGLSPMLLLIDFFLRFVVQETPAMLAKPYMLLPLPRRAVVETFLATSLLSGYNLVWLFLFLPYSIIVCAGGASLLLALGLTVGGLLLIMANSQFYIMVRTLISRNILWWALPIVVYGSYWTTLLLDHSGDLFSDLCDIIVEFSSTWAGLLLAIALLAALFMANRAMQFSLMYKEVSGQDGKSATLKHVYTFSFLERYGQTGEYLKLEIKSIMRNKTCRARVIMSMSLIVVLSLIIAYTSTYDRLLNFWCFYCFALYGMTALVKIMGPEGNYIDFLMVHRENILSLLKAKYYFHVAVLFVPLLLMLPAVIEGKFSWLMMLSYMLLTAGLCYFIIFQLAVYNKQTIPLDKKITGKGSVENGLQLLINMTAMVLPFVLLSVLLLFFSDTTAYVIMAAIGLVFTLLHPLWLRNVYHRMMKRKYENLEGFHATR